MGLAAASHHAPCRMRERARRQCAAPRVHALSEPHQAPPRVVCEPVRVRLPPRRHGTRPSIGIPECANAQVLACARQNQHRFMRITQLPHAFAPRKDRTGPLAHTHPARKARLPSRAIQFKSPPSTAPPGQPSALMRTSAAAACDRRAAAFSESDLRWVVPTAMLHARGGDTPGHAPPPPQRRTRSVLTDGIPAAAQRTGAPGPYQNPCVTVRDPSQPSHPPTLRPTHPLTHTHPSPPPPTHTLTHTRIPTTTPPHHHEHRHMHTKPMCTH